MEIKPTTRSLKAKRRGAADFRSGKTLDDNPYLRDPLVALSSWWQTGFLHAKNESRARPKARKYD